MRASIQLDREFSDDEILLIQRGIVPKEMEDKWFLYWQGDTLFFHRSWTGFCVYEVHFQSVKGKWQMTGAEVNRDPEQYRQSSNQEEAKMIGHLIDLLLLRRGAPFPSEGCSPEEAAIKAWSSVGRASLGHFPSDDT